MEQWVRARFQMGMDEALTRRREIGSWLRAVGGWSCAGPTQFDGSYAIEGLPTGHRYLVYAEPLNGAVDPSQISNAAASLCRNATSDPGWPALLGCVVPPVDINFTVRTRPGP